MILTGGPVFSGRAGEPWAEAVLLDADCVVETGALSDLRERMPRARVVDVEGGTVLPGLIDAHNHALSTGEGMAHLDLRDGRITSSSELLSAIAIRATTMRESETVEATGFRPESFSDGGPSRADLDRAAPRHGVVLHHVSGHGALVSTAVLVRAGVDDSTPDPDGGRFVRDEAGRLTGMCLDNALGLVLEPAVDIGAHGPNFHVRTSDESLRLAWRRASTAMLGAGLTTVCDAQVTTRELHAYRAAHDDGELRMRVVCMPLSHALDDLLQNDVQPGDGDEWLHLGPVKLYADGTLLGGTAVFSEPLCGQTTHGQYFRPVEEVGADIVRAARHGWRVGVHAIGDAAIDAVLPWLELGASRHPEFRPRIEHAMAPSTEAMHRFAALGGIAVVQPSYLVEMGDSYRHLLGDRAYGLLPLQDMLRAGIRVVISSDSDVASFQPLRTIAAAMTRTDRWGVEFDRGQRLSLEQGLQSHTADAAVAVGRGHDLGQLRPGYKADVTILDTDLRTTGPEHIAEVGVRGLIIDGKWVALPHEQ